MAMEFFMMHAEVFCIYCGKYLWDTVMGKHSNLVRFEKSAANTPQHGADIDGILQKGPTRHAYAWRMGPFWQDTLDM